MKSEKKVCVMFKNTYMMRRGRNSCVIKRNFYQVCT